MREVDFLIEKVLIVTMNEKAIIEEGFICLKDGKITDVTTKKPDVIATKIINGEMKLAFPGFINTHTHLPMTYFRGLADDLPLHTWLTEHIFPAEAKMVNPDFVYASAVHGAAEMLKNGIVMINDMYYYGDYTAKACIDAGLRALIGEGAIDFPVYGYKKSMDMYNYSIDMNKKYTENPLIDFCLAPHSIYTCGEETLIKAKELAKMNELPVHIHLSETKKEVDDCLKKTGKMPVEYLQDIGFFDNKVLIAHGVWITESEMDILNKYDISILLNTESNLKLASGIAPVKQYINKGINLTIGTDGVASNNNLDMLAEISITAKLHKGVNLDPTILPAYEILKMATVNGAEALNKSGSLGKIVEGYDADLILIDYSDLDCLPMYNPYSSLVYSLTNKTIRDVFVRGERVVENGKLVKIDEDEIKERLKFYADKIIKDKG